ncbi:MAG: DUF4870 domain-containing protein [Leptolyngbyaceae cyanobacterium SL_7_1]|nr:DUF4870 domain-containing protein [Leptolyngbyaceae cyanobacterium SL_7_1]
MDSLTQRKLLSALSHGAIFFSSFVVSIAIPIAILLISEDPVVTANAKESLHFHINLFIYGTVFLILAFVLVGIPLLVLLVVASVVMPILAIIKVLDKPDQPYRYPFLFRLF